MIIMTTIHTWYPLMDQNFFVCLVSFYEHNQQQQNNNSSIG